MSPSSQEYKQWRRSKPWVKLLGEKRIGDKMADIIFDYGAEQYGLRHKKEKTTVLESMSRRQEKIEHLIQELSILQGNIQSHLTTLR